MNFEDEPYVRLYTRKTLTSKLLGWEGRAVLRMMIDEFDPSGVFEIRGEAAECVAAVTDVPVELVRIGLRRLIETETWVVSARAITWPTYEEAQNCRRSDRVRQRESRRARSRSFVTDVTAGHSRSQPVTLPSSHPPSAPTHPGDRARARGEQSTEPDQSRAHDLPCEQPLQEYLDAAQMGGVSLAQAKSTWKHYWGNGLPPNGVLRLIPWLVQRAKERQERTAKAPPSRTQATRKPLTAEEALKQCP